MIKNNLLILIFLGMTILSACQDVGQVSRRIQGPSDGGGGDTCNGRMIESYRVNILDLPEYKEYVSPRLQKVIPAHEPESGSLSSSNSMILFSPHIKNWYIIDCKLDDIPKERKGLFLDTYQTAMHTKREIFIDSKSYKSMSPEEKGKLLLHEMVMGLYLSKYLTLEDFCKLTMTCNQDYSIVSKWKRFRPKPYQPLNAEDHQKIRNVTIWLWADTDSQTPAEFSKLLEKNDFDQRFANQPDVGENHQEIDLDPQVLIRMFKKHQWTKSFPQFCQFDRTTNVNHSNCRVDIQAGMRTAKMSFSYEELYFDVKIERISDKKIIRQEFTYPLMGDSKKIKLYSTEFAQFTRAAPFMISANWPTILTTDFKEGMKSYSLVFMIGLKDLENPEIFQMIYESQVWHTIEEKTETRDGQTYQETYAHGSPLTEESETLFIEAELPFTYQGHQELRSLIKSTWIPTAQGTK